MFQGMADQDRDSYRSRVMAERDENSDLIRSWLEGPGAIPIALVALVIFVAIAVTILHALLKVL